jgi:hypothetical protein
MITIISLAFSTSKTPTLEVGVLEVEKKRRYETDVFPVIFRCFHLGR